MLAAVPVCRERAPPRQLQGRIVAMARDSRRPCREAERDDRRQFETARRAEELLLDAGPLIARIEQSTARRAEELLLDAGPLIARIEHTVFGLEHLVWNDCAAVRDGGPIGRNRRRGTACTGRLCRGGWNGSSADEQRRPDRTASENGSQTIHRWSGPATR